MKKLKYIGKKGNLNFRIVALLLMATFCGPANIKIFADKVFRDHRFSTFKVLPPCESGDVVFIGNSITNMNNWDELFGNRYKIKNRGVSGAVTSEILENLPFLISGNPSKVFVMIGTNDLGSEGEDNSPNAVACRIKEILSVIRALSPETEVYFQSILPSDAGSRTNAKIAETNDYVEKWIADLKDNKLYYVDLFSEFSDETGGIRNSAKELKEYNDTSLSFDGLHLTQRGYKVWANIISEEMGGKSVIAEKAVNLWGGLRGSPGMRASIFGVLPIEKNDILLIGDEMIHGGEWQELLNSTDFKDRGNGWNIPSVSVSEIDSITPIIFHGNEKNGVKRESPKGVVLYAGFTDLTWGRDVETVIGDYQRLICSIKESSSSAPLFIMTLTPSSQNDEELNRKITDFNENLRRLANPDKGLFLIDIEPALTTNGTRDEAGFFNPEFNYLNGTGYIRIAGKIAEQLNNVLGENYEPVLETSVSVPE